MDQSPVQFSGTSRNVTLIVCIGLIITVWQLFIRMTISIGSYLREIHVLVSEIHDTLSGSYQLSIGTAFASSSQLSRLEIHSGFPDRALFRNPDRQFLIILWRFNI
jgi:hypothetical protein